MYLKKKATVLISTMMILSLMSMLGCFMFKMMRNNNELGDLYKFDKDKYDLDKAEEEILNKFMEDLNKNRINKLNEIDEENGNNKDIFSQDFEDKIQDSSLEYNKNNDKMFLKTNKNNEINRKREITYSLRDEKIILVPTCKFEDKLK
ncbi:hypothetical protein DIC82_15985 [Clostridium beijerinckii]|nr:hypothetical protein DIC82_15985 [Clostridium beijerinckii]